jgi:hypothetical protein
MQQRMFVLSASFLFQLDNGRVTVNVATQRNNDPRMSVVEKIEHAKASLLDVIKAHPCYKECKQVYVNYNYFEDVNSEYAGNYNEGERYSVK